MAEARCALCSSFWGTSAHAALGCVICAHTQPTCLPPLCLAMDVALFMSHGQHCGNMHLTVVTCICCLQGPFEAFASVLTHPLEEPLPVVADCSLSTASAAAAAAAAAAGRGMSVSISTPAAYTGWSQERVVWSSRELPYVATHNEVRQRDHGCPGVRWRGCHRPCLCCPDCRRTTGPHDASVGQDRFTSPSVHLHLILPQTADERCQHTYSICAA
jgi:hypothetical protein